MIIPDINLLIYAYDSSSPWHREARKWWEGMLSGPTPVGLGLPVAYGFIRLTTRAAVFANPLPVATATQAVRDWLAQPQVQVLVPGPRHLESAMRLLDRLGTAGNLTTDVQLAALAIEFQAELHSADTDFARFPGLRWVNPISTS